MTLTRDAMSKGARQNLIKFILFNVVCISIGVNGCETRGTLMLKSNLGVTKLL